MSNFIKSGTTSLRSATRGIFSVGISGSDDYGPTNITGFYNGITPPVGGYTIYVNKSSGGPSINVANNDAECIFFLRSFGSTGTTITEVLTWADTQTNLWVTSSDLTSADILGPKGSLLFDLTPNQYLTIPNNSAFSQDVPFTYEGWIYPTVANNNYYPWMMLQHNWIGPTYRPTTPGYGAFTVDMSYIGYPPGWVSFAIDRPINNWYHVAVSWDGSNGWLFINGRIEGAFTGAGGTVSDGQPLVIAQYLGVGVATFPGYISNFRVVKGTAVYTSAFTPPTSPLIEITNTVLLLNTTNDSNFLKDHSVNNFTVTNVGSVTSSSLSPFV